MNLITFSAPKTLKEFLEGVEPVPIKTNIPEWFKKLNHTPQAKTIKGCKPFLDALTAGYLIKMPQDFYLKHNVWNEEKKIYDSSFRYSVNFRNAVNLNSNDPDIHDTVQLKGSPLVDKNSKLPFYKILNPYTIKTPPGYSCIFTSPLNNRDDRFEIITGIVDTDSFEMEINFPIVINSDKYKSLETIIERGTPIVQVIPFKREDWKLKVEYEDRHQSNSSLKPLYLCKKFLHNYKDLFWKKKKWM